MTPRSVSGSKLERLVSRFEDTIIVGPWVTNGSESFAIDQATLVLAEDCDSSTLIIMTVMYG